MSEHRAVVIDGPEKARLVTRPTPVPGPGQVLVRTAWTGICATDLEILEGRLGFYKSGFAKYPIVPGHELSGRIAAVGEGVRGLEAGTHVVVECIQGCGACVSCRANNPTGCPSRKELGVINLDGGYAEYFVAAARFVHEVPKGTSLRLASLTEPLAVVCKGLGRLADAWGDSPEPRRVAVIGGGAIGTLAALALKARGHKAVIFDREPHRRALAAKAALEAREDASDLSGFDAVVEATGNPEALAGALRHSRASAAILLLGLPYDERPFSFESLVISDKTVVGSVGSRGEHFDEALRLLPRLGAEAFAVRTFALEDYQEAWDEAAAKGCLKAVLKVDAEAPE